GVEGDDLVLLGGGEDQGLAGRAIREVEELRVDRALERRRERGVAVQPGGGRLGEGWDDVHRGVPGVAAALEDGGRRGWRSAVGGERAAIVGASSAVSGWATVAGRAAVASRAAVGSGAAVAGGSAVGSGAARGARFAGRQHEREKEAEGRR